MQRKEKFVVFLFKCISGLCECCILPGCRMVEVGQCLQAKLGFSEAHLESQLLVHLTKPCFHLDFLQSGMAFNATSLLRFPAAAFRLGVSCSKPLSFLSIGRVFASEPSPPAHTPSHSTPSAGAGSALPQPPPGQGK